MKLHYLKIQAFGPFSGIESIDFSQFENSLFLIDGPTGAGKSSVLHAVCYALYGKTTDVERKDMSLRCDYSAPDKLTELFLEFSIRGEVYQITRSPTQIRPAKQGDGYAEHKAVAHLCRVLKNGEQETLVAKRKLDADIKIKAIIGLSLEQFRQVMVLPQGKFRALLLANSKERQLILSTLFQTEIYKRIEELLKQRAGDIEKKYHAFETYKKNLLVELGLMGIEHLGTEIERMQSETISRRLLKESANTEKQSVLLALQSAESLVVLFNNQAQQKLAYQQHLEQYVKIEHEQQCLKLHFQASEILPIKEKLQDYMRDGEQQQLRLSADIAMADILAGELTVLKETLISVSVTYQQLGILKAEYAELQGYQAELLHYDHKILMSSEADNAYQQHVNIQHQQLQQRNRLEKERLVLEIKQNELAQQLLQKTLLINEESQAKKQYEVAQELAILKVELSQRQENHVKGLAQKVTYKQRHDELVSEIKLLEQSWLSQQAVILAQALEHNTACLVCGSLEHPNLASSLDKLVNQEQIKDAREYEEKSFSTLLGVEKKLARSEESIENTLYRLDELNNQLGEAAGISLEKLAENYRKKTATVVYLIALEQQQQDLKRQLQLKNKDYQCLLNKLKEQDRGLAHLMEKKATANAELAVAATALPDQYRDMNVLLPAIESILQKILTIEQAYEKAQLQEQKKRTEFSAMQVKIKLLARRLVDVQTQQYAQSVLWQQTLINSQFIEEFSCIQACLAEDEVLRIQEKSELYYANLHGLKAKLSLLAEQLKGKIAPDLDVLKEQLIVKEEQFSKAELIWMQAEQHKSRLLDVQAKIKRIEVQQTEVKAQYNLIGTLSKAASGRGDIKVSLERFVLSNLLNKVLSVASLRLNKMSKGQYRLIIQDEKQQSKNTHAGLDLAIDDAHTGKIRPVATLSGGESFLASLALALALSEVVQQRSGGIQLDTLFIDEGFGSLDQESLQLAINTLIDLQSTGRTIGVISHVSELKEQMSKRIEVQSSRGGSHIKMVAV